MTIHLRIISPTKVEHESQAEMVLLPGEDGEFGVLPNHMEMIAALKEGVIRVFAGGSSTDINIKGAVAAIYKGSKVDITLV